MRRAALLALAPALAAAGPAARADEWRWAAAIDMSARYASNLEDRDQADRLHQTVGRVELRGLAGKSRLGLAAAFDLELGFEVPAGFAYGAHLLPLGLGLRLWGRSYLGVVGGAGLGGSIDRVGFAWELPVAAFLEVDLGGHARAIATGRAVFTPGSDARAGGARDAGFADELELGAGLAVGKRHHENEAVWSDGTYVGLTLREQLGARMIGLVVAVAMNGASD